MRPNQNPWVQLYEARRAFNEPDTRPPGRPPSLIPRRKVGMTLSQGEIHELEEWQERFSNLLGRKVSAGETLGILTRICSARLEQLGERAAAPTLIELVERMVTDDISSSQKSG